jgi:hypothetical protein
LPAKSLRAAAHVDELHRDIRALAVVGDRETHVVPRDDPPRLWLHLVEPTRLDAPSAIAVEGAEPGRAVARKRFHARIGKAGRLCLSHDVLDRVVKAG